MFNAAVRLSFNSCTVQQEPSDRFWPDRDGLAGSVQVGQYRLRNSANVLFS
jgi:hypothetical protein